MSDKPVFVEFCVVDSSGLINVPSPRKALINLNEIASIESLGDRTALGDRCLVILYEPADTTVDNGEGELVLKQRRWLSVKDSYESIKELLEAHATVVRSA